METFHTGIITDLGLELMRKINNCPDCVKNRDQQKLNNKNLYFCNKHQKEFDEF